MQLITLHDVGTLQGGYSVQLIISHDVVALDGGHSVLFPISYRGLNAKLN